MVRDAHPTCYLLKFKGVWLNYIAQIMNLSIWSFFLQSKLIVLKYQFVSLSFNLISDFWKKTKKLFRIPICR